MTKKTTNPWDRFGYFAADAAKAFDALRSAGASLRVEPFFKVEHRKDGFLVSFYEPKRCDEIRAWLSERGYKPSSVNRLGCHVFGVDSDTALLAKLTWGGAA